MNLKSDCSLTGFLKMVIMMVIMVLMMMLPHMLPARHRFNLKLAMVVMLMTLIMMMMVTININFHLIMIEMPDWSKYGATKSITSSLSLVIVIAATTMSTCNIIKAIVMDNKIMIITKNSRFPDIKQNIWSKHSTSPVTKSPTTPVQVPLT